MKLESFGILIDIRPLNERDSVARIFSRDYGVMVGMVRGGAIAKKNKPLVGQIGNVVWNARLDSQLGVFHWDIERNLAAIIMTDSRRLAMMNAAFSLLTTLLPERESYTSLYTHTLDFLAALPASEHATDLYLSWEITFLREIGYAIDTTACAGCGSHKNLNYLSPRTCRAVCDNCAAPYIDKLYQLPINMTLGRRLLSGICAAQGAELPVARQILGENV